MAIRRGTTLNPAAVGFLDALGLTKIKVCRKPRISILAVGDELIQAGVPLSFGQIYESNSSMLASTIQSAGYNAGEMKRVSDDLNATLETLQSLTKESDICLVSGGISVGDYDLVGKALKRLKADKIFYKINQRPGKPLFFGKLGDCLIFALPGNPSACLTCFYEYVYPSLRKLAGHSQPELLKVRMPILHDYATKGNKGCFFLARIYQTGFEILDYQNSSMLKSYTLAEALVYFPAGQTSVRIGDLVETLLESSDFLISLFETYQKGVISMARPDCDGHI